MHNAVQRKETAIIDLLMEEGADPNILDKDKFSPLGLALRDEHFKCAYKLIKHPLLDVNIGAGLFCSMLHLAVAKLEVIIVEKLIEKGCNVNVKETNTGDTPLHLLINVFSKNSTNSRQILEIFAVNGADLNMKNNE